MKQSYIIGLLVLLSMILASCNNDAGTAKPIKRYPYEFMFAEWILDELNVTAKKTDDTMVRISIMPGLDDKSWSYYNSDFYKDQQPRIDEFIQSKLKEVRRIYNPEEYQFYFTTASIDGIVTITADVSLFGENPGEDISDHFHILQDGSYNSQSPLLKSNDYLILYPAGSNKPERLSDYFSKGTILNCLSEIALIDIQDTNAESATINISIPVEEMLYLEDGRFNENADTKKRNRTLTGTVTIDFK